MDGSRRTCKCPINDTQDGVCGCPQFWKLKHNHAQRNTNATPPSKARIEVLKTPSPSPTPTGPPKQICFFWYHGSCRRGERCTLAHESHITWPLSSPPGYVHYEPCKLPLCPLREALVACQQTGRKQQLSGQLDGATMSRANRAASVVVIESDYESDYTDTNTEEDEGELIMPYIDLTLSDDESESDDIHHDVNDAEENKENVEPLVDYEDLPPIDMTYTDHSAPTPIGLRFRDVESDDIYDDTNIAHGDHKDQEDIESLVDYKDLPPIDMTYVKPNSLVFPVDSTFSDESFHSAASILDTPANVLLLFEPSSRPLTGPYSDCSDSGNDDLVEEGAMKPATQTLDPNTHAPPALTPAPPTTEQTANLSSNMDYVDLSEYVPPVSPSSDAEEPLLSLSHMGTFKRKRTRTTLPNERLDDYKRTKRKPTPDRSPASVYPQPLQLSKAPACAPRGPRAQGGSALICFYWYHKGYCSPRPRRRNGQAIHCMYAHSLANPDGKVSLPPNVTDHKPDCSLPLCPVRLGHGNHNLNNVKNEPHTPPKLNQFTFAYNSSSSPRDELSAAQAAVDGHKFRRDSRGLPLPKLTGVSRSRFKTQMKLMEKWQVDNKVTPHNKAFATAEDRKEQRKREKQRRKQKKKESRMARETIIKYEDDVSGSVTPETTANPARRPSTKKMGSEIRRRASALFEADFANGGKTELFDPEAEQYKESFHPIDGFPDLDTSVDHRDEMEERQQRGKRAMDSVQKLRVTYTGTRRHPMIDSKLPTDDGRLEWDTDLVRRLFGEIA
ncbi:hypothetical protein CC86DRAFT_453418 [Ophiobolus disseminans]|uniref:C3H1-type domain-containing protein n=1 Tax=Ophiobolus disseminans TaxID=1469910 RepID=A0A6A7A9H5_9PLEO|nr:hypothetical protein CC86DRAFT_453418 [Ophiobolus disseminans]